MYIFEVIRKIPIYVKIAFLVISTILLHYFFGWLPPLLFNFLVAGFLLDEFIMISVSASGTVANAVPTIYYYFTYNEATVKITADLSKALGNMDAIMVMLISVFIPLIMYIIAGLFAWQIAEIRMKLTS